MQRASLRTAYYGLRRQPEFALLPRPTLPDWFLAPESVVITPAPARGGRVMQCKNPSLTLNGGERERGGSIMKLSIMTFQGVSSASRAVIARKEGASAKNKSVCQLTERRSSLLSSMAKVMMTKAREEVGSEGKMDGRAWNGPHHVRLLLISRKSAAFI